MAPPSWTRPKGLFVSVDVDSLDLYQGLYGKQAADRPELVRLTYELGVRRFLDLFDDLGIAATFFLVGRDLENPAAVAVAREAASRGHSLGNHSFSHPYDLIRQSDERARREIKGGHDALAGLQERPANIFRAPGYNVTAREYGILEELGYRYDASPLPSYPYLMVKYAVMALLAAKGTKSRSIWGNPLSFMGRRGPYRKGGLTILPNAATSWLRLPVIGTSLTAVPRPLLSYFLLSMLKLPFVGLEFHAIDLIDRTDPIPEEVRGLKELSVPLALRQERFRFFLRALSKTHGVFVP